MLRSNLLNQQLKKTEAHKIQRFTLKYLVSRIFQAYKYLQSFAEAPFYLFLSLPQFFLLSSNLNMFQYHPQDLQQQNPSESSINNADLYLLFNKYSSDANGNPIKKLTKSKSTPVSVEASPHMSEKEDTIEQTEAEDAESPSSHNSKRYS